MIIYIKDRYFSDISNLKREFREVGRKRRASNIYKLVNRKLKKDKDNKEKEDKKKKRKKSKSFSDRDIVPRDIALKGKKEGVVQKDQNGDWRIISYKTNPPEFWDAHYDSKEDAEKALGAYHAQKHYSSYDGISDDNLEDEVYKRSLQKYKRRRLLKGSILGGIAGAAGGFLKSLVGFGAKRPLVGAALGTAAGAAGALGWGKFYQKDADAMNSKSFQKILKKEYEKAYKDRPHLTNQYNDDSDEEDYENYQQ